ncbi:MAG: RNA polymerase sigma factor [Nannocystaceae bacterium]
MEERKAHDQPTKARATNHSLSLAEVYREYADFVWRMARRQGVAACELEDVVHDVFLVVHRRLPDYDGRAGMKTWLFHLTRGVVSNGVVGSTAKPGGSNWSRPARPRYRRHPKSTANACEQQPLCAGF